MSITHAPAFYLTKPRKRQQATHGTAIFNGKQFHWQYDGPRNWSGWFEGNDAVTIECESKRELFAEAESEANWLDFGLPTLQEPLTTEAA